VNPAGNERLTAAVGLLLLVPILVELATILLGVHTFMSLHVFVGLTLIPPVLLKLGSTGWRFARYYLRSRPYVIQGPPQIAMRLLAPLFVTATVVLFGSGVAMGFLHGHALQIARRLHGPASVIWLLLLGLHVLVYLKRALRSTAEDAVPSKRSHAHGATARAYALAAVVISGLVLGAATIPAQHHWIDLRRDHPDQKAAPRQRGRTQTSATSGTSCRCRIGDGSRKAIPSSAPPAPIQIVVWTPIVDPSTPARLVPSGRTP